MDFDTSFRGPVQIAVDYTKPFEEVHFSGGTCTEVSHGGQPKRERTDQPPESERPVAVVNVSGGSPPPTSSGRPRPIPQATYTQLEIPVSTCKALKIGCWPSSPIDSDALRGKTYPNFLHAPFVCSYAPDVNVSLPTPTLGAETTVIKMGDGPFPSPTVYECSDVPKQEIASAWKLIEREMKLGRLGPPPPQEYPYVNGSFYCNDPTSIVPALKANLKRNEITFKSQYSYGMMEYRHCITANRASCWMQESPGIMWAGVYGIDDICVVTLSGQHLDWKRVHGCLASFSPEFVLSSFRNCVLSELEDLAVPPCKLSEEFDGSFDPPFCVVSEIPTARDESGHETSSAEYAVRDAVSFVQHSGLLKQAKDSGGAIKLAISAFQRLMGKKFEAKEIAVTVLFGRKFGTGYIKDLDISEIGDYLAAVEWSQIERSSIERQ